MRAIIIAMAGNSDDSNHKDNCENDDNSRNGKKGTFCVHCWAESAHPKWILTAALRGK